MLNIYSSRNLTIITCLTIGGFSFAIDTMLKVKNYTEQYQSTKSADGGGCLILIVLGFNDTSTLEGHFVSSPREREKRDRRESRGDEREGQGRKRNRNESEETEEIKTFPLYPYPLQG